MIASLVLNVALVFPLAHARLALATALGAFFNAALLLKKLLKENVYKPVNGWLLFFIRVSLASGAMSAGLYYFVDADWWNPWSSLERVINLAKWIGIGGCNLHGNINADRLKAAAFEQSLTIN